MENNFKILLATDYSQAAYNAERYAVQFAKDTNSTLYLLHVYEIPFSATPANPIDFIRVKEEYKQSEIKVIEQHKNSLFNSIGVSDKDVKCECITRMGNVTHIIREEADDLGADFILVGTHGATNFRETLFGS